MEHDPDSQTTNGVLYKEKESSYRCAAGRCALFALIFLSLRSLPLIYSVVDRRVSEVGRNRFLFIHKETFSNYESPFYYHCTRYYLHFGDLIPREIISIGSDLVSATTRKKDRKVTERTKRKTEKQHRVDHGLFTISLDLDLDLDLDRLNSTPREVSVSSTPKVFLYLLSFLLFNDLYWCFHSQR